MLAEASKVSRGLFFLESTALLSGASEIKTEYKLQLQ